MEQITDAQKILILESNGWQSLWHPNNWVPSSWLKDPVRTFIDRGGLSLNEAFQEVIDEISIKDYYNQMTDNHPTIHCNRFPSWSELTDSQKAQWREQYKRERNKNGQIK